MLPPIAYAAIGALLLGVVSGWTVRDWKADADALAALQEAEDLRDEMQARVDESAKKYEELRSRRDGQKIQTRNTIREIYRDRPIAVDCAVPPDAASVLQQAIDRANAAASGGDEPAVPKPAPSSRNTR
jgi:hypothetical protein